MRQSQTGACDRPSPKDLLIPFAAIAVAMALLIEITSSPPSPSASLRGTQPDRDMSCWMGHFEPLARTCEYPLPSEGRGQGVRSARGALRR